MNRTGSEGIPLPLSPVKSRHADYPVRVTTGHFPGSHAAHANSPQGGIIVAVTAEM
ncbi:hypothetical protein ABVL33_004411 [Salmonella enterica]|nr:hypothetical protein [Salmonella enterica]